MSERKEAKYKKEALKILYPSGAEDNFNANDYEWDISPEDISPITVYVYKKDKSEMSAIQGYVAVKETIKQVGKNE
jgi:hypothetical protein